MRGVTTMGLTPGSRLRRFGVAKTAGLIAVGVVAGGVAASAIGASAATSTSSQSAANSATVNTAAPAPNKQSTPVRSDEKSLSSGQAATVKAAALKAVPGGTVYRIETDAGDGTYEAHMTKADGSLVTVKFDKNLAVTKVEAGMGAGDPAPTGQYGPGPGGG
jgi:hypothetical protein